jgi:hypothetical protein
VKGGKIVLVSTCGFWEPDNFEPLLVHLAAVSKNIHREFSGALLRPHGALMKYLIKSDKMVQEIPIVARAVGSEFVKTGVLSEDKLKAVSRELISRDEYMKMLNDNFLQLRQKYE